MLSHASVYHLLGMGLSVMFKCMFVSLPCGILCQVWYLIDSIPNLCSLSYFSNDIKHDWVCKAVSEKKSMLRTLQMPLVYLQRIITTITGFLIFNTGKNVCLKLFYNQATTNLAFHSNETFKD